MRNYYIINDRIRAREVRLIDEEGGQLGVVATLQAIKTARERGYDLVLISPGANPPVAKIADLGKLKYEAAKKDKETRKSSRGGTLKEIKISPKIAEHDFNVRLTKTKELLTKRHKVKVSMFFRGRENMHVDIGKRVMERFLESASDLGKIDSPPKKIGKNMHAILSPK